MGKEVKIGLAVIGVLLCVFGGVLFYRLRGEQPATAKSVAAAAKKATKSKETTKLASEGDKTTNDRYKRSSDRTAGDSNGGDRQPEPTEQPPDIKTSPYRNRPAVDRYGRNLDLTPADDSVAASDDADAETEGEDEPAADEVAMPRDRFAQPLDRMAFSDDTTDEDSAATDDRDEDADAPRLSLERIDRYADRTLTQASEDQSFDAEETEDAVDSLPATDDDSDVAPAADDRYAQRRYDAGQLRERAVPHGEETVDEENSRNAEVVDAADQSPNNDAEADTYVVEPHDNFWRISQKVYGTGAYYKALEEYNRGKYGQRALVNPGDEVAVPSIAVLRENYPDLCPKARNLPIDDVESSPGDSTGRGRRTTRTYTVVEGDTLFDIARRQLGKATRWAEIYRLNRDQLGEDFNNLSPGMELLLPAEGRRAAPMASRPQLDGYRR